MNPQEQNKQKNESSKERPANGGPQDKARKDADHNKHADKDEAGCDSTKGSCGTK